MLLKTKVKEVLKKVYSLRKLPQYKLATRKCYIPIREIIPGQAQGINEGPHAGKWSEHRIALLNTLIKLKPKVCLEIGTYHGATAQIFEYYFNKYQPDGVLFTADIRRYQDLTTRRIRQVIVYPHVRNIADIHLVTPEQMLPGYGGHFEDSAEANTAILRRELHKARAEAFDFCYIDGDHQELSFVRDLTIARNLAKPDAYMMIDDICDEVHECARVYREKVRPQAAFHYEFEDWPVFAGVALVNFSKKI